MAGISTERAHRRRGEELIPALLQHALRATATGEARLAPERALARELGSSRATLRQALTVLARWGVTHGVQGSGIQVRPRAEWSLGALPALVAAAYGMAPVASPGQDAGWLRHLAADALALRRQLVRQLPARIPQDLGPGALDAARRAADRAFSRRESPPAFVAEDAAVVRAVLHTTGATATAWAWNELGAVAVALARGVGAEAWTPPGDYVETQETALGALERGEGRTASRTLATHLARLDRVLLRTLPAAGGPAGAAGRSA